MPMKTKVTIQRGGDVRVLGGENKKAAAKSGPKRIDPKMQAAQDWFGELTDKLRNMAVKLEHDGPIRGGEGTFEDHDWAREAEGDNASGGEGHLALLEGQVFEKLGIHTYTIHGEFAPEMRNRIPGASRDPRYWSCGMNFVAHPRNPLVPAAHFSSRLVVTTRGWFGGSCDLCPALSKPDDTMTFHAALREVCDQSTMHGGPGDYDRFKARCDDYYFMPHRGHARGVGGLHYDDLNSRDWSLDFQFVKDLGLSFVKTYEIIVRRRFHEPFEEEDRKAQLDHRGRLAEFLLLHDKGVRFGLATGGEMDAVLMAMPPLAAWR